MNSSEFFSEIEQLNLPSDQFVVLGSGILAVLGIRAVGDVDLLMQPVLFDRLKDEGWKHEIIEIEGRPREKISKGNTEAFKDFWWNDHTLTPDAGIAMSQRINGISFIPLPVLVEVKRAMGREKDLKDVALIEEYLRTHSKNTKEDTPLLRATIIHTITKHLIIYLCLP